MELLGVKGHARLAVMRVRDVTINLSSLVENGWKISRWSYEVHVYHPTDQLDSFCWW
jgi:hypothetical protein